MAHGQRGKPAIILMIRWLTNCVRNLGQMRFTFQPTRTGMPVVWVKREQLIEVMQYLKSLPKPYVMLYDLHGVDERVRTHRQETCRQLIFPFSII